jgi:putative endonuclease
VVDDGAVAPRPSPPHLQRGARAEARVAQWLEARGLRILFRNYRCRAGELDLVAQDADGVLAIIEVRCRSRCDFGSAADSVDGRKQARIRRASRHLLRCHPALARKAARYDVVEAVPQADRLRLRWIRGAFTD